MSSSIKAISLLQLRMASCSWVVHLSVFLRSNNDVIGGASTSQFVELCSILFIHTKTLEMLFSLLGAFQKRDKCARKAVKFACPREKALNRIPPLGSSRWPGSTRTVYQSRWSCWTRFAIATWTCVCVQLSCDMHCSLRYQHSSLDPCKLLFYCCCALEKKRFL